MPAPAVTSFHIALAIHVATIVMTFGAIFARPLVFAVASRQDPRSLPILHRIEYTFERYVMFPGVLVVILSGSYMAAKGSHWDAIYVWWGIGVVALLGVALAVVMIPTARRAEAVAQRDLHSAPTGAVLGLSGEYRALTRRLGVVSSVLGLLLLITMLFMGLEKPY
ncbi:MAG TPA: hypothetical protein VGY76_06635 [Solirubrobacteraceae bacterium]|jgi:hypothetical protein|nr:hypothetical protein [Solirubrobacteraceae bacterium]